jgi:hypothetical protein
MEGSDFSMNWSMWDKAEQFWLLLAGDDSFVDVRTKLHELIDSDTSDEDNFGLGGRTKEKLAVLYAAWERWRTYTPEDGAPFSEEDREPGGLLCLSYTDIDDSGNALPPGQVKLVDTAEFGGIDWVKVRKEKGKDAPPMPPPPTREQIAAAAEKAQSARAPRKRAEKMP